MLGIERKKIIENKIIESGSILISDLIKELNCSDETIRRDLKELENEGKIKKIHGGACSINQDDRGVHVKIRNTLKLNDKQALADYICDNILIKNESIMLDSSTTCVTLAKTILKRNLQVTIITNSLLIFNTYSTYSKIKTKLIGIGGIYRERACSFVGFSSDMALKNYLADKCFISCSAIDLKHGLLDNSSNESRMRLGYITQSRKRFLIADNTKFGDTADYIITNFDNIDIVITLDKLNKVWEQTFNSHKVKLICINET